MIDKLKQLKDGMASIIAHLTVLELDSEGFLIGSAVAGAKQAYLGIKSQIADMERKKNPAPPQVAIASEEVQATDTDNEIVF